ncbi:hypothetical protein C5612_06850 [Pseudomonas frederiksbergensis]|uniref:Uncharacterized protein n=1 Tax=Pseudomonas frederiksbergensis TaxID=104087 RepID=A0A2S8HS67_9PSED|nr:hypothetical protein C5612_06850 [Pseudomonas frederiksbergensis]
MRRRFCGRFYRFSAFQAAFASKPAPTLDLRCSPIASSQKIQCGSGLARECITPVSSEPRYQHHLKP